VASAASTSTRYFDNIVTNNILYKNLSCSGGTSQISIGNPEAIIAVSNAVVTMPPQFVDETSRDFRLTAGSPMIDQGTFLTRTVGSGSGTQLRVEDTGYFFDGYQVAGEVGDIIQLEGQSATARIVSLDDATGTVTLDRPLTWGDGQRISLRFTATRPDAGAFEYGLEGEAGSAPAAPSSLRVTP
jgi:hypothetical protein